MKKGLMLVLFCLIFILSFGNIEYKDGLYYENGELFSGELRTTFENKNYKVFNVEKGKKIGIEKFFTSDKIILKEIKYYNGQAISCIEYSYFDNGQIKSKSNKKYITKKSNISKDNSKEENLLEASNFLFGENIVLDGEQISYYENGKIKTIISYNNGSLNGVKKLLKKNGDLIQLEEYKDGALIGYGEKRFYDFENRLQRIQKYYNDELTDMIFYNEDGSIKSKEKF